MPSSRTQTTRPSRAIRRYSTLSGSCVACVAGVNREHALTVLGVERPHEEVSLGEPLRRRVAEQRLDLRAREDVRARLVEGVDVDDERELFDQRPVATRYVVVTQRVGR